MLKIDSPLKDDICSIVVADCLGTVPSLGCLPVVFNLLAAEDAIHPGVVSGKEAHCQTWRPWEGGMLRH